jgi:hypothetical protein
MKKLIFVFVLVAGFFLINNCNNVKKEAVKKPIVVEPKISKDSLLKLGMPERITNQYIEIRKTKKNQGKSFYIVDTKENLIFLFDKTGNFVAKSPTIDGFDKQNSEYEKDALKSWMDHASDIGFEWDYLLMKYIDNTGKKRIFSNQLVFIYLTEIKSKFFPKGIYKITSKYHDNNFIGSIDNTYDITTLNDKPISLSIHGLYKSEYRIKNMNYQMSLIESDFKTINVPKKYIKEIIVNDTNKTYNNSFGCINVPEEFLKLANQYAVGSLVFVMGENNDYLIK